MATKFNRSAGGTFSTNGTVTSAKLHNLVDELDIYQALITDQTPLTSVGMADELLIADADLTSSDAPRSVTVQELFDDALTIGTYTNAQLTGNLTYGTATGNRTISTSASITTGTINNATLGTTTGTAATITSGTITTGVIPSLTAGTTTSTAANITNGTIGTFNSTTSTISNLTAGTTTSTAANITSGTIQTLTSSTLSSNLTGGTISGSINSTGGTIQSLTSSTATVSDIITAKNAAINVTSLATASGTQNLDFSGHGYLTHSITGNITYTASNYSSGKSLTVRITSDGTARNLTFPTNWVFVGSKPTSISASKNAILSVTSFGATEAESVAAYAVQS